MTIKILPNEKGAPSGKLADAELHFASGPLAGLKLLGFAIWESRSIASKGGRASRFNVTFPARTYSVNGERRSFALLRPGDASQPDANNRIRDLILAAYAEYEQAQQAPAPVAPVVPTFDPKQAFTAPTSAPTMAAIRADVATGKPVALTAIIDAQRAERAQTTPRKATAPSAQPQALDLF